MIEKSKPTKQAAGSTPGASRVTKLNPEADGDEIVPISGTERPASSQLRRQYSQRFSLWILTAMIILKLLVARTPMGILIEERTFALLQNAYYPFVLRERPQVVVVSMKAIPVETWIRDGRSGKATSRVALKNFIQFIADSGAKAIGVAIDFSPEPDQENPGHLNYVHPDDGEFFEWCLRLADAKHIRIYLGVFRMRDDPEHWLKDPRYRDLAALTAMSSNGSGETIAFYQSDRSPWPLPGMSAALAGAGHPLNFERSRLSAWLIEDPRDETHGTVIGYSIVNRMYLSRLVAEALSPSTVAAIREVGNQLDGRIVLLGDTTPSDEDKIKVNDIDFLPVVFLLAAGVETQLNRPLHRFTVFGGILVDILLALLLVTAIYLFHLKADPSRDPRGRWRKVLRQGLFTLAAVGITIFLGTSFIVWTQIIWTDFILVSGLLVFSWFIESVMPFFLVFEDVK